MTNKNNKDTNSDKLPTNSDKLPYDFGKIEKITVESPDLEVSVFALADAMPGGDGLDPSRRIPAT